MTTSTRPHGSVTTEKPRRHWRRPEIRTAGTLGEVLKSGSNKVTISDKDTFDSGKPVTEA